MLRRDVEDLQKRYQVCQTFPLCFNCYPSMFSFFFADDLIWLGKWAPMWGVDYTSSRIYKASFKADRSYAGEYLLECNFRDLMGIFMDLGLGLWLTFVSCLGLVVDSSFYWWQETTARRAEAWAAVERSLNSRLQVCRMFSLIYIWNFHCVLILFIVLQEAEAKAAGAEERERSVNERLSQTLSRINVLEAQVLLFVGYLL